MKLVIVQNPAVLRCVAHSRPKIKIYSGILLNSFKYIEVNLGLFVANNSAAGSMRFTVDKVEMLIYEDNI